MVKNLSGESTQQIAMGLINAAMAALGVEGICNRRNRKTTPLMIHPRGYKNS